MTSSSIAPQRASVPATGRYRLDPARSSVTFRTRHLFGLGVVSGTTAVSSGEITIDPVVPQAAVAAVLSAASFSTGNRSRDRDVRSAEFLHPDRYPDITFRAGKLSQAGGRWMLAGELAVRDVTRPVTLAIHHVQTAGSQAMTRSKQGPGVAELSMLTSHLVTGDPAAAASWYGSVLGAVEQGRVTLPGGRVLSIELRFGHRWATGQHIRDVPPGEVARLAAEPFGQGQS